MKRVSVVILNWNGVDMLRKFIPSVMDNSVGEGIEICVADNASSDGSLEMLRSEFPVVRLIELDQNYGFAEGYNRALEQVDAEYVVLLNSDVEVTPHWLEPLLDYMDTHSGTVACQPKLLSWHNKEYFEYAGASGGFIDRYGYPFCRGRIFDVVEKDCGQYDTVTEVMWVTGAALFIRLADYREVGGLDGHFFAHMEEIDLCWRLRSRGKKLVCIPQSVVYHVGGATLKKENPRKTFLNFRNNLLMLYKNLPDKELTHVMRMRRFLDYLAAFETLVLKRNWGDFKAIFKARRAFKAWKHEFDEDRRKIQAGRVKEEIPQVYNLSIIWQYYAKGKKLFSQL
jgi:GT2 family glycosyltransferase